MSVFNRDNNAFEDFKIDLLRKLRSVSYFLLKIILIILEY
jgi:hypothetical protein